MQEAISRDDSELKSYLYSNDFIANLMDFDSLITENEHFLDLVECELLEIVDISPCLEEKNNCYEVDLEIKAILAASKAAFSVRKRITLRIKTLDGTHFFIETLETCENVGENNE